MNVQLFLAFSIAMGLAVGAEAVCCKRKSNFLCCGNGPCNIFCCNCDGGCNEMCQNTHCNITEWVQCAGALAACATACVVTEGEACIECLGLLYDTCVKCYSSNMDQEKIANDTKYMMEAYYKIIMPRNINMENVQTLVKYQTKDEKDRHDEL